MLNYVLHWCHSYMDIYSELLKTNRSVARTNTTHVHELQAEIKSSTSTVDLHIGL